MIKLVCDRCEAEIPITSFNDGTFWVNLKDVSAWKRREIPGGRQVSSPATLCARCVIEILTPAENLAKD